MVERPIRERFKAIPRATRAFISARVLFISRILGGVAAGGIMPVCMALIGDTFSLAVRQVALSRYIGSTLIGQLVGASVGGVLAEWIGWRGVLGCAAALTLAAAVAALIMMPRKTERRSGRLSCAPRLAETPFKRT